MGSCTAQCKMLLFCANTLARESAKFELSRLKEEEEEPILAAGLATFWAFAATVFHDTAVWDKGESSWPGKHSKMNSKLS